MNVVMFSLNVFLKNVFFSLNNFSQCFDQFFSCYIPKIFLCVLCFFKCLKIYKKKRTKSQTLGDLKNTNHIFCLKSSKILTNIKYYSFKKNLNFTFFCLNLSMPIFFCFFITINNVLPYTNLTKNEIENK